jgi:hypothetical protein
VRFELPESSNIGRTSDQFYPETCRSDHRKVGPLADTQIRVPQQYASKSSIPITIGCSIARISRFLRLLFNELGDVF